VKCLGLQKYVLKLAVKINHDDALSNDWLKRIFQISTSFHAFDAPFSTLNDRFSRIHTLNPMSLKTKNRNLSSYYKVRLLNAHAQ